MTTLVIAEHDNATLKPATLNTVTAASELALLGAGEVHLLVAGHQASDAALAGSKISGVAKVIRAMVPPMPSSAISAAAVVT